MFNLDDVLSMLNDGGTHRKQFSRNNGVQKGKRKPTFSVPFDAGLCGHFLDGTGMTLKYNREHDQHYCFLDGDEQIELAEAWADRQGTRVFIRNLLNSTTALDLNFVDNESGQKTEVGRLEQAGKHSHSESAISELAKKSAEMIGDISYLREADVICALPANADKDFDLPSVLAKEIGNLMDLEDVTPHISVEGKEKSAKNCALEEKWAAWEAASISFDASIVEGKRVLLVDDKYQSGLTMHYFAGKLIEAGATEVHGIAMVKTLRDTDNLDVVES